ncbi:hypothetical protein E4T39_06647 [Aureobasidium subglaciale]|nr:hypothetical protein E4T39_06647 [Aureobasidium subglaciale]
MASQMQDTQAPAREQFAEALEINERCRQQFIYEYDQAQSAARGDANILVATQQVVDRSTVYDDEDDQITVASDDADDGRDGEESTDDVYYDEYDEVEEDDDQLQREVEGEGEDEDEDLEENIASYADSDNQIISSEHNSQDSDAWSVISGSTTHSTTVRLMPRLLNTPDSDLQPLLTDPCDTCDEESGEESENESYQDSDDYNEESCRECTEEGIRADQAEEELAICIEGRVEEASRADHAEKQLAICIEEARVADSMAKRTQKDLIDTNEFARAQSGLFRLSVGQLIKDLNAKHHKCMRLKDAAEKLNIDSEARYIQLETQYNDCMLAKTAAEGLVEEKNRDIQVWEQAHALEHEKVNLANNKLKWVNEQLEECLTDRITLVDEKETSISEKEILLQTVDKLEHQKNEAAAKWFEENEALKYSSALSSSHYQRHIEDLKESHDQQIALVQDTIEALTSEHEDELSRVEREYTAENEDLKECYQVHVNRIAALEKQNKAFRKEADQHRCPTPDTATLQAELKASKTDTEKLKDQLVGHEDREERLEYVTREWRSCVKQIEELEAELLSRETERKGHETMVQMVKNARLDKSKTEDWCNELKNQLETTANASEETSPRFEKLRADHAEDQKKLQDITEERERLLERNEVIHEMYDALCQVHGALRRELKEAIEAGEALEDEIEEYEKTEAQESDDQKKMAVFNHIFPTIRDLSGEEFQQNLMELQNSGTIDIETLKTYLCSLMPQVEEEL